MLGRRGRWWDAGARLTWEDKRAHLANQCTKQGVVCALLGIQKFDLREWFVAPIRVPVSTV